MKRLNIPNDSGKIQFYQHPEIIPPFEFAIDTQDCIRVFTGGPRVGIYPREYHTFYDIPISIVTVLKKYNDRYIKSEFQGIISFNNPEFYVAGYFIEKFFTMEKNYTHLPRDEKIIDTYIIS